MGDLARLLGGIMAAPPLDPAAIRYYRRELKGFLPVDELMTIVLSRKIMRPGPLLTSPSGLKENVDTRRKCRRYRAFSGQYHDVASGSFSDLLEGT